MSDLNQSAGQYADNSDLVDSQDDLMPGSEQQNYGNDTPDDGTDLSDRTKKEFEKLKDSNRRLKEQLDVLSKSSVGNSVYDSIGYGQAASATGRPVDATQFVDQTGNVDIIGLNHALLEAGKSAHEAKAIAEDLRKREDARMVSDAHSKHPWLDPRSDEFDSTGYELVRDRLVSGFARGQNLPLTSVADAVLGFYTPESLKRAEAQQGTRARKAQASSTGATSQNRAADASKLQKLKEESKKGNLAALDERIRIATANSIKAKKV